MNSPNAAAYKTIDTVNIHTKGNAIDFGDIVNQTDNMGGSGSNPVRGIFSGGYTPTFLDVIESISIPTTGNAQDFGNLTAANIRAVGMSNSIRTVMGGGQSPSNTKDIEFITTSTLGNSTFLAN